MSDAQRITWPQFGALTTFGQDLVATTIPDLLAKFPAQRNYPYCIYG
jgi:hypothetical protein